MKTQPSHSYPLVSIISVNYNQSAVTLEMLGSFKDVTYPNYEIIVVDNGSPNDNPRILKEKFPDIKLVISEKNLGFAGGNNLGIKEAEGKYLLFLNNDTEVTPQFLEPLVEVLEQHPEAGMVSPLILYYHSPEKRTIQYAGAKKINLLTGRGKNLGWGEVNQGQYSFVKRTDYAHGAALLLSRKVLDQVGCMPDVYFLYYEELDWCTAMIKQGLHPYFAGTSVIYHKESVSIGKNSPVKVYYMTRNRLVYLRRNAPVVKRAVAMLFFTFVSVPVTIIRLILKKESRLVKWLFKAIVWNVKNRGKTGGFPRLITNESGQRELIHVNDLSFHEIFIRNTKKQNR